MTGASDVSRASIAVWWEEWDRSTIMPSRLSSFITVWKKEIMGANLCGEMECSHSHFSELGEPVVFRYHVRVVHLVAVSPG